MGERMVLEVGVLGEFARKHGMSGRVVVLGNQFCYSDIHHYVMQVLVFTVLITCMVAHML